VVTPETKTKTLEAGGYRLTTNDPVLLAVHRSQWQEQVTLILFSFVLGIVVRSGLSFEVVVPIILFYTAVVTMAWSRLRRNLLHAISHVLMLQGVVPRDESG
jgi:hypothetical protein